MHSGLQVSMIPQATAQSRFQGLKKNDSILVLGTQEGLNRYLLNKQNASRPTAVVGKDVKSKKPVQI